MYRPDALDLRLLQALQLDGRAPFSRIAEVLGVSDQTVARRYRRLRTEARLRVLGMADHSRLGRTNWIVRLRCNPDAAEPLADALARRPDTSYIGLMSGGTEVMCAMRPRSVQDRDELLLDRIPRTRRVTSVDAYSVLHHFYGGPLGWLNKIDALDPAQEAALRQAPPETVAEPVVLDPLDETLLELLRHDGRTTVTDLATATGQTESVVKRRVRGLRRTGVLYFDIEYDHEPFGHGTEAVLWLTVEPTRLRPVGQALADHREVRFAAAVSGQANVVVSVLCRTTEELFAYLADRAGSIKGVRAVEAVPTLRQVKTLTYDPRR
ncbi:Lrp/AsnC family transcriptional regulator [Streptomyces sp. CA-210063]|uniref:Lrp/AsnC family transcriptional regulator n=1 Tax=Streptomyces sp. CA-210063 TaxID=2801029 RepID=UPI00214AD827|nr:Lrp/AsnC family transcriptional regulator [Streptomyces sp. CA-210063]UUU29332.1 Lrp/AsnC family transcriptional regulator [Streptomyces sp. CA-210063]